MAMVLLGSVLLGEGVAARSLPGGRTGFGLGILIGEPTAIIGKKWLTSSTALIGAAGWSFGQKGYLHLHADYLLHQPDAIRLDKERLTVYFGLGGRIRFQHRSRLGIRIPVGLNYFVKTAPIDLFVEVVPVLDVAPATVFHLHGGIGARFFFP
ncbi:MAG: hypothetical protein D6681_19235 [Calditrichaeota bacterium]|nr:MAG: hypothetical protein D6681_19235 [Calditrichota bacterium]